MLEVITLTADDVRNSKAGGAGRVELVGTMDDGGLSPDPQLVEKVAKLLPVRPMLRLTGGFGTPTDHDFSRLAELADAYYAAGADGVVLGYLTKTGLPDLELVESLVKGRKYTFHRAVDSAEDYLAAWECLLGADNPPDIVLSAGSESGVTSGLANIQQLLEAHPAAAELLQVGGGLRYEHLSQLRGLGVKQFHIGSAARVGEDFANEISVAEVEKWVQATS